MLEVGTSSQDEDENVLILEVGLGGPLGGTVKNRGAGGMPGT